MRIGGQEYALVVSFVSATVDWLTSHLIFDALEAFLTQR
jgi:hypothetical protein